MSNWNSLEIGQKVLIVLKDNRKFEGTLDRLRGNHVDLVDVVRLDNNSASKFKFFEHREIEDIIELDISSHESTGDSDTGTSSGYESIASELKNLNKFNQIIESRVAIKRVDLVYYDAIQDIQSQFIIGISTETLERNRIFKYLAISTNSKVYIFHFAKIWKIDQQLEAILSNQDTIKVVYNHELLKENLKKFLSIELNNVSDTFYEAHHTLNSLIAKNFGTLMMCVFKIDRNFITDDDKKTESEVEFDIAQRAVFLIPLHIRLLNLRNEKLYPSFEECDHLDEDFDKQLENKIQNFIQTDISQINTYSLLA
jgi:hypothetical protein